MRRRDFLRASTGIVGAGCIGASGKAAEEERPASTSGGPAPATIAPDRAAIQEAPRSTPVAADVDVVVVGGGPTGIGAALAAAGEGATTLVVERHGMLGGMWTAGLLNPLFDSRKGWLVEKLIARLREADAWRDRKMPVFDPERMKFTLEQMLAEANAQFWYHVQATDPIVADGAVRGVVVEGKSGREAVLAKVVVDCTGDGDVAARAGVPFQFGRKIDGLAQPMTLMFEVTDVESFEGHPADELEARYMLDAITSAIEKHHLPIQFPYGKRPRGTPWLIQIPRPGVVAIQATHVYRYDATSTRDVTQATVEARRQAHEIFLPAMRKVPGMENIRLSQTAPSIGVRESRHLEGQYTLSADDVATGRRFDDAVACCTFGCDIHEIYPDDPHSKRIRAKPFEIPYRCLVPKDRDGLVFAGRCISGEHEAHASYRVTGTCMAMGQAAGLAAAIAAQRNVSPSQLDGRTIHDELRDRGAVFLG